MSIKLKLYCIGLLTLVALGILFGIEKYGEAVIHKAVTAEEAIIEAEVAMLEARRSEKDFLGRKDMKYVARTDKVAKEAASHLKTADANIKTPTYGPKIKKGLELIDRYIKEFHLVVGASQRMGLTNKEGLEGELRGAVHEAEDIITSCKDDSLMAAMLMLRRHEKDFMLRHDKKYLTKFNAAMKTMQNKVALSPSLSSDLRTTISNNLSIYHEKMNAYVEQYAVLEKGRKQFTDTVHELAPMLEDLVMSAEAGRRGKETFINRVVMGVNIGTALLLVLGIMAVIRSILGPITSMQDGTSRVAEGDYDACNSLRFAGELEELRLDIVDMVAEIKRKISFAEGVLNGIVLPCSLVGPDGKMMWANQQMLDLLALSETPKDIVGWISGKFFFDDENKHCLSEKALEEHRNISQENVSVTDRTGKEIIIDVSTTPFDDMDGVTLGTISFWLDKTEINTQQNLIKEQNEKIAATAKQAFAVADQTAGAAEELSAQIEQSSRGTEVQRERVTETATAMEEMNATVLEVARNASGAAEGANTAKTKAQNGQEIVESAIRAITQVQEQTQILKNNMERLGQQAEGIGNVMNVISDIADQTNLLALNAAIEAARAGDAGRGFAVVADEVRKLAEKTMGATKEVGSAITSIQQGTQGAAADMEKAVKAVEDATELAGRSGEALREIVTLVDTASDQVRSIATASEQQSATSEEINRAVDEISNISSETAAAMTQSAQAVADMARLSQELNTLIRDLQDS